MKNLLLIICFINLGMASSAKTATDTNRFSIAVYSGVATPLGGFGSSHGHNYPVASDSVYGFAKVGFHYEVTANWYFSPHFSIILSGGGNINSFNTQAYAQSIMYYEATETSTSAHNFYSGNYFAGISYYLIQKRIRVGFAFLGGMISANYPTVTTNFSATSSQPAGSFTSSMDKALNIGWQIRTDDTYQLNKHFRTGINIDYSFAFLKYPSYAYSESLQDGTNLSISRKQLTYMRFDLVTLSAVFSYTF